MVRAMLSQIASRKSPASVRPEPQQTACRAHEHPAVMRDTRLSVPRLAHRLLAFLLAAALFAGCGDTRPARQPEGTVAFRSGSGPETASQTFTVPGLPFQRSGMLVPAHQQTWQSTWAEEDQEHPLLKGAGGGLTTGLGFLMITPMAASFWPAAVGIVVASTAMGMLGITQTDPADARMSAPDRAVIVEATMKLQPDRFFREAMEQALRRRTGEPLQIVTWHMAESADTAGTDPLIEARARGLDGVLDFAIDALGLAAGEERDTFGVFVQVRVRALDARDGQLRYERVLSYGPGFAVPGLPRSDFHTVEFLAADQGRVYRQVASDAIRRLARVLAADTQLPLAP
jgi:hypothetical protein